MKSSDLHLIEHIRITNQYHDNHDLTATVQPAPILFEPGQTVIPVDNNVRMINAATVKSSWEKHYCDGCNFVLGSNSRYR